MYSDPAGQPAAAALRERPHLGLFVLVGGYATMLLGMLALPLQSPDTGSRFTQQYFSTASQLASVDTGPFTLFPGVAKLWWSWLALGVFALLGLGIAMAAALPAARRWLGWVLAVLTLGTAAYYTVALQQTGDIYRLARAFQRGGSTWEVAGSGVWVGYAGLGVILLGAIITGLIKSPAAAVAPPPNQPFGPPPGQPGQPYWQQQGPVGPPQGQAGPPPWQTGPPSGPQPSPYAQQPGGPPPPPATHPDP